MYTERETDREEESDRQTDRQAKRKQGERERERERESETLVAVVMKIFSAHNGLVSLVNILECALRSSVRVLLRSVGPGRLNYKARKSMQWQMNSKGFSRSRL